MHDDLTDEVRAPTARTVHAYGERPGPPLAHRAPGLFWCDADREQGRAQGTRAVALEEGSKRLRRHHRPQLNRVTESHRALRQRLRRAAASPAALTVTRSLDPPAGVGTGRAAVRSELLVLSATRSWR